MNGVLEQKIKMLPLDSGVYVMLDENGKVIYVGKAKVLKNRVKQYFYSNKKPEKVAAMVANIADFYYIITHSEIDALSLENNLIKKYKPRYNILLKDDKTYPYIKVNMREPFPNFTITRKIKKDGARYFGPFMGGVSAKETLEIVNVAFSVRTCKAVIDPKKPKKECLEYHLKKCLAPCAGFCDGKIYREQAEKAVDFLSGNDDGVEDILRRKMEKFAALEEFEIALSYREKLKMLEKIKLKRITALNAFTDIDVFAAAENGLYSAVSVLFIRGGRMQGAKNYSFDDAEESAERLEKFISQYYGETNDVPDEIILSEKTENAATVEDYIKSVSGKKTRIISPERGIKRKLAEMAAKNCADYLEKEVDRIKHKDDMTKTACKRLKEVLGLKNYPKRAECYDISHISGVDKVGSMVVFYDGEADKNSYRRFRIKTVEGSDDFACLKEVLSRRIEKLGTGEEEKFPRPDLVIIDGGKGQLSSVKEIFDRFGIDDIDLISIAKKEELIYTVNSDAPFALPKSDYALKTVQRLRDEAHRFAITYHRATHGKNNLNSVLKEIDGVGEARRKSLMNKFGTVENVRRASVEELAAIEGIGEAIAVKIKEFFENEERKN